jgi:hypothetical protein
MGNRDCRPLSLARAQHDLFYFNYRLLDPGCAPTHPSHAAVEISRLMLVALSGHRVRVKHCPLSGDVSGYQLLLALGHVPGLQARRLTLAAP